MDKSLLENLQNHDFFKGLALIEISQLEKLIYRIDIKKNQKYSLFAIKDSIIFVLKGKLSFYLDHKKYQTFEANNILDGNALLRDVAPGIGLSLKSSQDSKIYILRLSDLKNQIPFVHICETILDNLRKEKDPQSETENTEALKRLARYYRNELEHRLMITQKFIVSLILLLCSYILCLSFIQHTVAHSGSAIFITLVCMGFCAGLVLFTLYKTRTPASVVGFTLTNTRAAVRDGILYTLPFLVVLIVFKWVLIQTVPSLHHLPVFDYQSNLNALGKEKFIFAALEYPLISVPLQEIVFRSGVQGFLQYIFARDRNMTTPIVLSSIVLCTVHVMISPLVPFLLFIPSLLWGWLFAKHHNLIGVCISHGLIGVTGFFLLGYFQLMKDILV